MIKKHRLQKQTKTRQLKQRAKKKISKRVGAVAEARSKTILIDDDGGIKEERKRNIHSELSHGKKVKKQRRDFSEETINPHDCWVKINGIGLTYRQKEILASNCGWLTDDHVDAAQHLIKNMETNVGGLNSIVTMTYSSRFALPHEQNQTIQCHNTGLHWVTSSSITGKVIVYESLNTSLNASLRRQIINLYKGLCLDDGSLDVTVVLQQRQKGGSDCGLFSIANAVALAQGIDPCKISWLQQDMRTHLMKCFKQKKLEMFPHRVNSAVCTLSHYVISVYCVCFRHIPGAEMVYCNNCKNWYHHQPPYNCIKLSVKQSTALVTDKPFLCSYCEVSC